MPLAVLAAITAADPLSGITVALTLPLIPLFGALIGMATGDQARQRVDALGRLAHHFHDVVSGLPTLRVFGRARAQRARIGQVTGEYRRATMGTLRLAFLSSLALELIATMSVALVATEIGLRLAYGHLDLRAGLFVLILAPEAYLPLRNLGTQFHAAADGLAAAGEVFAILEAPERPAGARFGRRAPRRGRRRAPARARLIRRRERQRPARGPRRPRPGRRSRSPSFPAALTVLTGPSGCGKTTLLSCLLGFTAPARARSRLPAGLVSRVRGDGPRSTAPPPRVPRARGTRGGARFPPERPACPPAGCRRTRPCSRARWGTTSGSAGPARPTRP